MYAGQLGGGSRRVDELARRERTQVVDRLRLRR